LNRKDILDIQTATRADYIITYYSPDLLTTPRHFNNNNIIYLGNRFDSNYSPSTAELTPESMIYISLGTVFNDKIDLFKLFIETFEITKYQVIISTGNNEAMYAFLKNRNTSSNIRIYKFVNQLEILSQASIFITHAGFNSIYEGLYFTVPMIMIPHVPEQYFNASRVKELKAGYLLDQEEIYTYGMAQAMINLRKDWKIYKDSSIKIRKNFLKASDNVKVASKIKSVIGKYTR